MESYNKNFAVIRKDERRDDFNLYTYELTERSGNETASYRLPLYSVRVSMVDAYGNRSDGSLSDAFSDTAKALKFYEKIVKHLATPIDLAYVFEDESVI